MITASNLLYRLPSGRQVLSDVGFHLPRGAFLAVLGENGAGKTTLLDLFMGFRRRTAGTLSVMDQDPAMDPRGVAVPDRLPVGEDRCARGLGGP